MSVPPYSKNQACPSCPSCHDSTATGSMAPLLLTGGEPALRIAVCTSVPRHGLSFTPFPCSIPRRTATFSPACTPLSTSVLGGCAHDPSCGFAWQELSSSACEGQSADPDPQLPGPLLMGRLLSCMAPAKVGGSHSCAGHALQRGRVCVTALAVWEPAAC